MVEMLKLIPQATSAIAVIIVVILFLQHLQRSSAAMEKATHDFTMALKDQRESSAEMLTATLKAVSTLEAATKHTNTMALELEQIVYDRYGLPPDHGAPGRPPYARDR